MKEGEQVQEEMHVIVEEIANAMDSSRKLDKVTPQLMSNCLVMMSAQLAMRSGVTKDFWHHLCEVSWLAWEDTIERDNETKH